MRRWIGLLVVGWVQIACSSDVDEAAGGCADISGNYSVKSTRLGGSCDSSIDGNGESTVSFTKSADGWTLVAPGLEGGCPGTLDAASCRFKSDCKVFDMKTGATLVTGSIDYTFSGKTFTGSTINAALPPLVSAACDASYRDNGTKL